MLSLPTKKIDQTTTNETSQQGNEREKQSRLTQLTRVLGEPEYSEKYCTGSGSCHFWFGERIAHNGLQDYPRQAEHGTCEHGYKGSWEPQIPHDDAMEWLNRLIEECSDHISRRESHCANSNMQDNQHKQDDQAQKQDEPVVADSKALHYCSPRCVSGFRRSSKSRHGPPIRVVHIPTGSSCGAKAWRAKRSAPLRSTAPIKAAHGKTARASDVCKIRRAR